MVWLDKTLFLSWGRAEPFEALQNPLKLHWCGLHPFG